MENLRQTASTNTQTFTQSSEYKKGREKESMLCDFCAYAYYIYTYVRVCE